MSRPLSSGENSLYKGRVALTRDAARGATPVSGVGTTLAVAGAYVLASEVAKTDDHAAVFAVDDGIMRPFVERGQCAANGPGWAHPQGRFGIVLQRSMLDLLSKPILRDPFLKLGMRDPDDIDLPDYRFEGAPIASQADGHG